MGDFVGSLNDVMNIQNETCLEKSSQPQTVLLTTSASITLRDTLKNSLRQNVVPGHGAEPDQLTSLGCRVVVPGVL